MVATKLYFCGQNDESNTIMKFILEWWYSFTPKMFIPFNFVCKTSQEKNLLLIIIPLWPTSTNQSNMFEQKTMFYGYVCHNPFLFTKSCCTPRIISRNLLSSQDKHSSIIGPHENNLHLVVQVPILLVVLYGFLCKLPFKSLHMVADGTVFQDPCWYTQKIR